MHYEYNNIWPRNTWFCVFGRLRIDYQKSNWFSVPSQRVKYELSFHVVGGDTNRTSDRLRIKNVASRFAYCGIHKFERIDRT